MKTYLIVLLVAAGCAADGPQKDVTGASGSGGAGGSSAGTSGTGAGAEGGCGCLVGQLCVDGQCADACVEIGFDQPDILWGCAKSAPTRVACRGQIPPEASGCQEFLPPMSDFTAYCCAHGL